MPTAGSSGGDAGGSKKRKSKWDDSVEEVPDWLKDLVPPDEPKPPPGVDPDKWKLLKLEAVQIRGLIGKGGETIRDIRARSGSDVQIDHLPQDMEGTVTITGDVEKTMSLIKESLVAKGCPLGVPSQPKAGLPGPMGMRPQWPVVAPGMPGGASTEGDISVPAELVGGLIGPGGSNIRAIREAAGNACYISVLPSSTPGALQSVRIVGDNRDEAKRLVLAKIEELKKELGVRPPALGLLGTVAGGLAQRPASLMGPGMGVGLVAGGHISGMTPNSGLAGLIRPGFGGAGGVGGMCPRPLNLGGLGGVAGIRPPMRGPIGALGGTFGSPLGSPLGGVPRPAGLAGPAGFGGLPRLGASPGGCPPQGGLTTVPRGIMAAMNRGPVAPAALGAMTGKSAPTQFGFGGKGGGYG